jgi:sugar phosphate isomerase/epimerase
VSADHLARGPAPGIGYAGIGDEAGPLLRDQVAAVTRLGWNTIELRDVDRVAVADLSEEAVARVAEVIGEAGLTTVCVDSRIANWARPITGVFGEDLGELEALIPRCALLGTRYVRVMSYCNDGLTDAEWGRRVVHRMRLLAERAERAGLVLLHENCAGWAGRSGERMLTLLEKVASPALGLMFDTGNGVAYGYEAYDVLTQIVDHVAHVQIKDADGEQESPVYCLPGQGRSKVADCLRLLLARGFTGTWSIEPHLTVRPHENLGDAGSDGVDAFVAYGRQLERLVREEVLPGVATGERLGAPVGPGAPV